MILSYRISSSKLHLFVLSLEIMYDLSSIVQLECTTQHIRLSCQDVFRSSRVEFLMDEIICLHDIDLQTNIITFFLTEQIKIMFQKLKTNLKNKEIKEQFEFWTFNLDSDTCELKLQLDETLILHPIYSKPAYHAYDTNIQGFLNHIFEVKTNILLKCLLFMCLGNGFFSLKYGQFKQNSLSNEKKQKTNSSNLQYNYAHKIVCKTSSESGEIEIDISTTIRKSPSELCIRSPFLYLAKDNPIKYQKTEVSLSESESKSLDENIVYFAVKFTKHFLTSLQHEQQHCLLYFIEDQNRCVIEPKGSPFRLILFSQPHERVIHAT